MYIKKQDIAPLMTGWLSKLEIGYSPKSLQEQLKILEGHMSWPGKILIVLFAGLIYFGLGTGAQLACIKYGWRNLGSGALVFFCVVAIAFACAMLFDPSKKLTKNQWVVVKQFKKDYEAIIALCGTCYSNHPEEAEPKKLGEHHIAFTDNSPWHNSSGWAWYGLLGLRNLAMQIQTLQAERRAAAKLSGTKVDPSKDEKALEQRLTDSIDLLIRFNLLKPVDESNLTPIKEAIYSATTPSGTAWPE